MRPAVVQLLFSMLLCVLLVAPAMASPIAFSPRPDGLTTDLLITFGVPEPNVYSILYGAQGLSSLELWQASGSTGSNWENVPPNATPVAEPSEITLILGSALFGILALRRRNSRQQA